MPATEAVVDLTALLDELRRRETPAVQRLLNECADRPRLKSTAEDLAQLADRLNGRIAGIVVPAPNEDGRELPFGTCEVLDGPRAKRATLNCRARYCVSALVAYSQPEIGERYCLERMQETFRCVNGECFDE